MLDQQQLHADPLLRDPQAAEFLGTTRASLRQSRYKGKLFGKTAPRFLKLGRSVRYRFSELVNFLSQFSEYANNAEHQEASESYTKIAPNAAKTQSTHGKDG